MATLNVSGPIRPLFPTLRSVGYIACLHRRVHRDGHCQDCGAVSLGGTWTGENMDYLREPLG